MLKTLLKQPIKSMLTCILPSPAKCFMYFFILIATVWASIAGYYYFSRDYIHCQGAIVSVGIFGALTLIALIWDFYLEKSRPSSMISEIVPKNYLLLKILYDQFKKHYMGKNLKSELLLFLPILIAVYLFFRRRKI